jgi:adenine-specific DNA-methyltransferase
VNFKIHESATKLRGGYYTPTALARWLVKWALARGARSVLEPGCGDGAFLDALARHRGSLTAIELDPVEAAKARRKHSGVATGDFFAWLDSHEDTFDAVVGNPPYIRYQYLDPEPREIAARLCEAAGVPISKLTNAWVPFVVLAFERLAPGGRLAMVIPAEIMHVHHANGLRRYLERHARTLTVVHIRAMVFPGALQGVVLLLVEKGEAGEPPCAPAIVEAESVEALPATIEPEPRPVRQSGRWMWSLLRDDEAALLARASERWPSFKDLASVDIGIVTGANEFFVTDRATVERHRLEKWVLPMLGKSEHVTGIRYTRDDHEENRDAGKRVSFLALDKRTRLTPGLAAYLAEGEEQGLPARYKCRIREPWWAVPYVWRAPVSLLKRCHAFPRLVLNEAETYSTDTAYRIVPRGEPRDLVGSFLSSLTLLSCELEGRHYGGGVLELVPSEIERLLVALEPTSARELARLDGEVRGGRLPLDRQDARLLEGALFTHGEVLALRAAWGRLRDRRLRRPPSSAR